MENPSQFIQGYRVLYRQTSGLPSPGPWQIQDMRIASERDVTLAGLNKGIVYEIKVRPYFNEFQGADSESMTARTMEEGKIYSHFWQNCCLFSLMIMKIIFHRAVNPQPIGLTLCFDLLLCSVATDKGFMV